MGNTIVHWRNGPASATAEDIGSGQWFVKTTTGITAVVNDAELDTVLPMDAGWAPTTFAPGDFVRVTEPDPRAGAVGQVTRLGQTEHIIVVSWRKGMVYQDGAFYTTVLEKIDPYDVKVNAGVVNSHARAWRDVANETPDADRSEWERGYDAALRSCADDLFAMIAASVKSSEGGRP